MVERDENMSEKILVSACFMGIDCKYNGGNNKNQDVIDYVEGKDYVLICPETIGGLSIPRLPSEIEIGKDGLDVVNGLARVYSKDGKDVTDEYIKGAMVGLEQAVEFGAELAILKEGSPSCGSNLIHDGTFSGNKKSGMGVTVALLRKSGIRVISEKDLVSQLGI